MTMKTKSVLEVAFKTMILLALLTVIVFQFRKNESIVYVDAVKLVNGYKGMQAARREFELKTNAWKANLDTLKTELDGKIRDYEATQSGMSGRLPT